MRGRLGGSRLFVVITAVLAVVMGVVSPQAGAAPASRRAGHHLPIQPAGDRGWKRSPAPKGSTFRWSAPKGHGATHVVKTDPHARVVGELTGKRSAFADFYRLSDGRVREKLSPTPVNYRDARGQWQPISTAVRPVSGHAGYSVGNTSNAFASYFSGSASSLVQVVQGGASIVEAADGAKVSAPDVSGNAVSYPHALGGADLRYQVAGQGLKEQIVLGKPPAAGAAPQFRFTLRVSGFVPRQLPGGAIAFDGVESGKPAFVMPAPYMSDAHRDPASPYGVAFSTAVRQSMTWDAQRGLLHLTVTPDAAWLHAAARVFPVMVDPTLLVAPTPSTAANVMILSDSPSENFATSWRLSVGTTSTGVARSLVKFPLPQIPAGTTISSAQLNLYYDQNFGPGTSSVNLEALQANGSWDPTTATWSNAGGIGGPVLGTTTFSPAQSGVWNSYTVTSAVQAWVNGTAANNGFVVRAVDESTLNQGGPRYEASIFGYGGEVVNRPQLVITYGVPGVAVNPPSVIHATGAELSWPAYTNTTGDPGNDLAEYQVHRSVFQSFTPDASTEISPVPAGTTTFTDSTATPTPADSSDPYGNAYYYMVVVKTTSGALIAGPTQLTRLPKAGLTEMVVAATSATTLSSAQPDTVLNTLTDSGLQQPWLEVGDDSASYGTTRAIFNFPALSQVPAGAKVIDGHLRLWQMVTATASSGASYELHALTRAFTGTQATWNHATSTTAWTTPGGDFNSTVTSSLSGLTNDPSRRTLDATSVVQGWLNTPSGADGLELKLSGETSTSPQERTIFAGPGTTIPQLAPTLIVTYLDSSTGSTYYAPSTPQTMSPGSTYTVPVTINNTTGSTWSAANEKLTYHWTLPDGSDVTTTANQLQTGLPSDLAPGATATVNAQVTPPTPADTNDRGQYTLGWDMLNTTTGQYLSGSNGIGSLKQATAVEAPGSNQLGLEGFYHYTTTATGAGSALYTNASSGNSVWSYNAFSNPSRGFNTFVRLSYNSLDTTDAAAGFGWSVQASTPTRLGSPLDFHPNPNPTTVTFTDGDGTGHTFAWNSTTSTWTSPPGVHLYLQQLASCGPQVTNARAWEMTRPDRTQFFYDCEGFPTAVVDRDGNEADFTYSDRQSENKPEEFLAYITDPTGRQTLTLSYYAKGDSYSSIDSTGTLQQGTKLTNPAIIDQIKSITDISGRTLDFYYTTQGLLARLVDGAGDPAAKTFNFGYDATQGMKNVKLVSIQDPRGNTTKIGYYDPPTAPAFHWWTQSVTDRLTHQTGFAYTQPGAITNAATQTTVTDANNHAWTYQLDSTGRLLQAVNPAQQKTTLGWDSDNNVTTLTEDNGAKTTWTFDPNTGYPLTETDAQANHDGTAATTFSYQTSLGGHIADITDKVSAAGRHWHFGYDTNGDLTSVQAPDGVAAGSSYTTSYSYDPTGQLLSVTDPNQHTTHYGDYDPTGQPKTITDALTHTSSVVYDPRGDVTSVTDPLGHTSTQNYDIFGRPLDSTVPKDQAGGVYITTPAPVYDANDNITQRTAPNGAVSTASYNADDEATASTLPPDTSTAPARTATYTYDPVGNQLTDTAPNGNLSGATPGSYTTTNTYNELNQLASVVDPVGDKTTYGYDDVGNQTTVTDPVKNATPGNTTATSTIGYDLDHRPVKVTDAAGHYTSASYDPDGLTLSATDANGNTTLYSYDPNGQRTQQQVPHTSSGGVISYDTTQYTYDQAGNPTSVISPRGVASGITGAYTTRTSYDPLNRQSAVFGAYNPNDPTYNTAPETDYSYDAAGRLTQVTAPPSGGQTIHPVTTYTYFDNGWTKSATDPFGINTSYDYNQLGEQTARTLTSAGGDAARTQAWTYYPDGTLNTVTDHGVPVGLNTELVDNSDSQNTTATGTWATSTTGTGYYGYDYRTHPAGTGTDTFTWNLAIPADGTYQVYVHYPAVTGAATTATYTITTASGPVVKTVDQTKNTGTWVSLGSYSFTQAAAAKISLAQNSGGAVAADAVKIVRDNSGDTQPAPNSFTYSYDADGQVSSIADASPGALFDTYAYSYDQADRLTQLQEKLSGVVKHTTTYGYNPDSQPASMTHDTEQAAYSYDVRNLLATVTNKLSSTDPDPHTTNYTYTPAGQVDTQTKGNGNVVTFGYNLDTTIATQVEKTSGGTLIASHTYTDDPNNNPTQDVSSVQNADNHAATVDNTATDTYTPADQIASVTNSNGSHNQTYAYDLAGNITSQTIGGTTTSNAYDRNRLLTTTTGGTTDDYNYDPFGRTDTITAAGQVIARYAYDGFDNITSESKLTATGMATTTYTFDPFARTTSQTLNAGTSSAATTSYDYLGTSTALADETTGGTVTKTYQYAPTGERLDEIVHNSDGTLTPTYYTYNPHTDVQAITNADGTTKATYGYTAYGTDDTSQDTGIDKNTGTGATSPTSTAQPYNPYRFNSDRIDPTTASIDTGFRTYDPSISRFLTRDMYNGALADQNLTTDPYTGNPYAFGDGNPLTNTELNGHTLCTNGPDGRCWHPTTNTSTPTPGISDQLSGTAPSSPSAANLPTLTPKQATYIRDNVNMVRRENSKTWNVPGTLANRAVIKYIHNAIYGTLSFGDLLKAATPAAVSFIVGAVGIALCPETAGATCLAAAGALAGFAGACAADCTNTEALALSMVVGAVAGAQATAAEGAAGDLTTLYRAVGKDELKDIQATGQYRPAPSGMSGKYFFPTKEQAENFQGLLAKSGQGSTCITSGCIPTSLLQGVDVIHPAGEGPAYFVPNELLPYFSNIIVHGP